MKETFHFLIPEVVEFVGLDRTDGQTERWWRWFSFDLTMVVCCLLIENNAMWRMKCTYLYPIVGNKRQRICSFLWLISGRSRGRIGESIFVEKIFVGWGKTSCLSALSLSPSLLSSRPLQIDDRPQCSAKWSRPIWSPLRRRKLDDLRSMINENQTSHPEQKSIFLFSIHQQQSDRIYFRPVLFFFTSVQTQEERDNWHALSIDDRPLRLVDG